MERAWSQLLRALSFGRASCRTSLRPRSGVVCATFDGARSRDTARVSSSDLDRARDMYDAWNNGNVDRMIEFWWDDATWEDAPEIPDRRIIRGRENVEARLREVIQVMGDLKMGVVELEELGDEILGSVHFRIIGSASGISIDAPAFHLIRFEEGRVRRYRMFMSREHALEAAEGD
jgi:ketosteroid isomerase-like protein